MRLGLVKASDTSESVSVSSDVSENSSLKGLVALNWVLGLRCLTVDVGNDTISSSELLRVDDAVCGECATVD